MHHIKAEYFLFHIVYVTQLFFYDIRLILLRCDIYNKITFINITKYEYSCTSKLCQY